MDEFAGRVFAEGIMTTRSDWSWLWRRFDGHHFPSSNARRV